MIWLNGRLVDPRSAPFDLADRGLLLADGLFETMRIRAGRPFRLDAHLQRLARGLDLLSIPLKLTGAAIEAAAAATIESALGPAAEGSLRITVTRGPGPRGLLPPPHPRPTVMIAAHPLAQHPPAPATAVVSRIPRNERSPLARLKSLGYLESVLARREAAAQGADEALFLNTQGRPVSATAANLFLVVGEARLTTPPVTEGALEGTVRTDVLSLARQLGIAVEERPLAADELTRATEAFLTNSLIEVRPLVRIEGRTVGTGQPGAITRRLARAYARLLSDFPERSGS